MPLDSGLDQGPDAGLDQGAAAGSGGAFVPPPPPVPVPTNPTSPGGGAGTTTYYGLRTGYAQGAALAAVDVDQFVNLLDNLGAGVLAALGAGTLVGGDAQAPVGLTLTVNAWRGILPQAQARLGYAPGVAPATALVLPASSSFVVWAVPVAGVYSDAAATPFDTAESGIANLIALSDGSVPDGGVPLLSGTSTTTALTGLADLRTFLGTAALATALAALAAKEAGDVALIEAAVGTSYFPAGGGATPAPLHTRVLALETGGTAPAGGGTGSGGGTGTGSGAATDVDYWDGTGRSATDPTTLPAYVAAQIPPTPAAPTPAPLVTDIQAVNYLKGLGTESDLCVKLVAAGLMTQTEAKATLSTRVDTYFWDPRLWGADPTLYDAVNSTAPVDTNSGSIG